MSDLFGFEDGSRDLIANVGEARVLETHGPSQCAGEVCCVHNPSDHPLRDAPLNWRGDRYLMERICAHGVGHPDPDHLAYLERLGAVTRGVFSVAEEQGVHGCDGCCGGGRGG